MSNINEDFIFALADRIADNVVNCTINTKALRNSINQSLGENARRMLEIGILQDELVKLGFEKLLISYYIHKDKDVSVHFFKADAYITGNDVFSYDSSTWQEDALNRVKELINAN